MSTYGYPSIVKYDGIMEDIEDEGDLSTTYVVIKKQPFITTLAVCGCLGFFSNCTIKISLNYYNAISHSVSADRVTFVSIYPIEYKTRVSPDGTEMEVESTIYALSSQHQGELFNVVIEVIENFSQYRHVIATVPLKVVSKSDSLSATMPTPEGRRRTITDMLGTALNKVELAEIHSTKMLLTLCKINGMHEDAQPNSLKDVNLGTLVQRLCQEYRHLGKGQRAHRLFCEVAGLMDEDLELLSQVSQAFCESFQKAFDINYEILKSQRIN